MTIFSIIKYPLSDPPTEEELANLPSTLFNEWCSMVIANVSFVPTPRTVASVFRSFHRLDNDGGYRELRSSLRHLLEKYEE